MPSCDPRHVVGPSQVGAGILQLGGAALSSKEGSLSCTKCHLLSANITSWGSVLETGGQGRELERSTHTAQ